jgi:hypothetical protein
MPYEQTIKYYIKKRRKREKGERGRVSRLCSLLLFTLALHLLMLALGSTCNDTCIIWSGCWPVPWIQIL